MTSSYTTDPWASTPMLKGFPLEFCNGGESQNTRMVPMYQNVKKCEVMSIHLSTIPALNGQSERRTGGRNC